MYKAIVFDLDDTLYDYEALNKEALNKLCSFACERYCISPDYFKELFDRARKETKVILGETGASHNRLLYCQRFLEYLGKPPVVDALILYEVYWGYMLEHMQLRNQVEELFFDCQKYGIKIGICSDLTAHIQHRKLIKLGIAHWIDAIVTSEEAGREKPAPVMFKMIAEKLKVLPQEVLFVGDSLKKDIDGDRNAGMDVLWFNYLKNTTVASVSSFKELRSIINEGQQY